MRPRFLRGLAVLAFATATYAGLYAAHLPRVGPWQHHRAAGMCAQHAQQPSAQQAPSDSQGL